MQIVVLDGYSVNPGDVDWAPLKKLGTLSVYDRTHPSMIEQRMRGADAVFVNKVQLTREILYKARKLSFIGELATGYDNIDIEAARERKITVCNVPTYCTESVAQLTAAMMLELSQHTAHMDHLVHKGCWTASPDFCYWDNAPLLLCGKTLGIIGIGRIGSKVALIGKALGMHVIGTGRSPRPDFPGEQRPMHEIFESSDIITLHCPANAASIGMINRKTIESMKDGVLLINTSRGSLLNESDVAEALKSGKMGGCAVDVVSSEPISKSNPLLAAPNCLITPHYAWAPVPVRQKLIDIAAANLAAFLNGSPINTL